MNLKLNKLLFLFLFGSLIISCKDEDIKPEPEVLLTYESQFSRSASELRTFINASGLKLPVAELQYDVELYKITYTTSYKGMEIIASGLVILPVTTNSVGMVSFQHGTIAAHSQAPSALALNSTELVLYTALSSPGLITVVPDFIGFGSSTSILHPYYVKDVTASSIMDMLIAAKELAIEKGIVFNGKLFLAGYSQGGYATMVTHEAIEKNGLPGFELTASFPSSGGYDVKAMQEYFFGLTTYHEPFYLAFVAQAYKTTLDWTQPLSDYFQAPYAARIPDLLNGSKTSSQINAELTIIIADFVTPDLLANIDTDPKYLHVVNAFRDNSVVSWIPTTKMYMYHGDADITVPYSNSVTAYNKLIANGASTSIVTLTALPGATHGTGVVPYIEDFIPKIIALK